MREAKGSSERKVSVGIEMGGAEVDEVESVVILCSGDSTS